MPKKKVTKVGSLTEIPAPRVSAETPAFVERAGCEHCWCESHGDAWLALNALPEVGRLADESHFTVSIHCCPSCAQRFVRVFTETIDWLDGEDPQYWTVFPVSEIEAQKLADGDSVRSALNALMPTRRCLHRDFPKGIDEPITRWSCGMFLMPHD